MDPCCILIAVFVMAIFFFLVFGTVKTRVTAISVPIPNAKRSAAKRSRPANFSAPVQTCVSKNYDDAQTACCSVLSQLKSQGTDISEDCSELYASGTFYDPNACGGICQQ